jgi:hypothetical protein
MKLILILLIFAIFTGCEKAVEFKLKEVSSKLVVEATIENGQFPVVVLSRSVNYFSKITPAILAESFVHDATIKISNGVVTHALKEYTVPVVGDYKLYYYTVDSTNLSTAFKGELDKSYSLQIIQDGKEYKAVTKILNLISG